MKLLQDEDRFLLFHQVGTGKTLSACILANNFLDFGYEKVLVYAPGPLIKNVWDKTLDVFYGNLQPEEK
jgi:hypothetical protein